MKKLLTLVLLLFVSFNLFAQITWADISDDEKEQGLIGRALCTSENEVFEITKLKSLEPYFIKYLSVKDYLGKDITPQTTLYVVTFTNMAVMVHEIKKDSKIVNVYIKFLIE